MTTECFTAVAVCPSCGLVGVHGLRVPRPVPTREQVEAWEWVKEWFDVVNFAGQVVRRVVYPELPDESVFEVIRACVCGREWGQV